MTDVGVSDVAEYDTVGEGDVLQEASTHELSYADFSIEYWPKGHAETGITVGMSLARSPYVKGLESFERKAQAGSTDRATNGVYPKRSPQGVALAVGGTMEQIENAQLPSIRVLGLAGLPEVDAGDDLVALTAAAVERMNLTVASGDVFVYTQKIVSKAEDRLVALETIIPSAMSREWSHACGKDPRLIELILRDSVRIVRMDQGVLIAETAHGLVCANAGVDTSNIRPGWAARLPADPDASARRLREGLQTTWNVQVGVIISDTFGRPWRHGQTNVAIGLAGVRAIADYRGTADTHRQPLRATMIAVADELAAAAELVMGKALGIPIAIIQGSGLAEDGVEQGSARDLQRRREEDLFR